MMNNSFADKQRARGLYECPDCEGGGMDFELMVKAMNLANATDIYTPFEEVMCKKCNGYGWLRYRVIRVTVIRG